MGKLLSRTVIVSVILGLGLAGVMLWSSTCRAQSSVATLHADLLKHQGAGVSNGTNSAGWSTGYSLVTSTREKTNPLGVLHGRPDRYIESTSKLVPNDPLGQPIRSSFSTQPNSQGWFTGYSAVTSTYRRPSTIFDPVGSGDTVAESVTRVVPNDPLGQPILPFGWP